MIFLELIFAVLIAVALAALTSYGFGRRGPGPVDGLLFFFLMLFLVIWAAGVWIEPTGPIAWGVPWLTFLVIGVVLALILAAAVPPRARPVEPPTEAAEASAAALALGLFFYLAMIALIIVIIAHYAWAL